MSTFLPTVEEIVAEKIDQQFGIDTSEVESHTFTAPEKKFYDSENRIDCFGLINDIPPFSGKFI